MITIRQMSFFLAALLFVTGPSVVAAATPSPIPTGTPQVRPSPMRATPLSSPRTEDTKTRIDNRAQVLVERLNKQNEIFTQHELVMTQRLLAILGKIEKHITRAQENGANVDAINVLMEEATNDVVRTQALIQAEQKKVFALTITNDSEVKILLQDLLKEFKADHATIKAELIKNRKLIMAVFQELGTVISTGNHSSAGTK